MKTLTEKEIDMLQDLSAGLGHKCASLVHDTDFAVQMFADSMLRCVRSIDAFLKEVQPTTTVNN